MKVTDRTGIAMIQACILAFIVICALFSCYGPKQAQNQFAKAVAYDPLLPANYCAITYPVKEKIIAGETVTKTDTIWGDGEIIHHTTVERIRDTVYVTKFVQGNTIRETIIRTDTVVKENTAAVEAERLNNKKLTGLLETTTVDRDKWKAIAKKRLWTIIGLSTAMALGLVALLYRKFKKKVPIP